MSANNTVVIPPDWEPPKRPCLTDFISNNYADKPELRARFNDYLKKYGVPVMWDPTSLLIANEAMGNEVVKYRAKSVDLEVLINIMFSILNGETKI